MPNDEIEFHEAAAAEYDAAFDWYLLRSPDAALRFSAEVDRALDEIGTAPQRWASGAFNTHRFLLRKFPFILIYREKEPGRVQVLAVAHTSRKPEYLKDRI